MSDSPPCKLSHYAANLAYMHDIAGGFVYRMSEVAYLVKEDDMDPFCICINLSAQEIELLDLCDFFTGETTPQ